jgi:hypothetical protein
MVGKTTLHPPHHTITVYAIQKWSIINPIGVRRASFERLFYCKHDQLSYKIQY